MVRRSRLSRSALTRKVDRLEKLKSMPVVKSLCGDRKLINACKKAGLPLHNPRGEFNGYGYEKLPLAVTLSSPEDFYKFDELSNELSMVPKKMVTYEDKKDAWCRRLAKLANISLEEAQEIAEEKEEYKEKQISMLEDRQSENFSRKREVLINSIMRSNPLRLIKDASHASAIMAASDRHKHTDYESRLDEGREKVACGEIEPSDVREYALKTAKRI